MCLSFLFDKPSRLRHSWLVALDEIIESDLCGLVEGFIETKYELLPKASVYVCEFFLCCPASCTNTDWVMHASVMKCRVSNLNPYTPTILKNILCLFLEDLHIGM